MEEKWSLKPPNEFAFPFPAYKIQEDFMRKLYSSLEEGKLGIFESPTGTGKSLSLICASLRWLKDHELRDKNKLEDEIAKLSLADNEFEEFDWLNHQAKQVELNQEKQQLIKKLNVIRKKEVRIEEIKTRRTKKKMEGKHSRVNRNENKKDTTCNGIVDDDRVDDESDNDLLLEDDTGDNLGEDNSDEDEENNGVKIYFCSRTHSQLSQFVKEVERSCYGGDIRVVTLASRQSYCINTKVNKIRNPSLLNERCLDLKRNRNKSIKKVDDDGKTLKKTRGLSSCPFLQPSAIDSLKEETLLEVCDVENLILKGKEMNACPYYSSRSAVKDAQLVVLPYNTLLHQSTRKASGINLKGSVVIIDEAHNLLDTIGHIHSSEITGRQLVLSYSQLTQYCSLYESRFSVVNLLHLNQLIFIVGKLMQMIGGKPGCNSVDTSRKGFDEKIYTLSDFVMASEIDNLNIYKILEFCQRSKIAHKLHSFSEKHLPSVTVNSKPKGIKSYLQTLSSEQKTDERESESQSQTIVESANANPMLPLISFLESLTNHSSDGRIVCSQDVTVGKGKLKFLLLNPASQFSDIIKEARSVIVAGGTMQPFEEFENQLFVAAGSEKSRIFRFACGHVIPSENILPIALTNGPSGKEFNFSFQNRDTISMISEIGRLLLNVCNVVPGGIVCFFPSYAHENLVYNHLQKTEVLSKLEKKKKLFREPANANEVDQVLSAYSSAILNCKEENCAVSGALLFSVVGGKLSEGLNFSDELGRCIVVVGMPYPNIKSPELQEKMAYLNAHAGPNAGQMHYENLCMKAVNQSIGRAVRHKDDYACVLLLDSRYSKPKTISALPGWIQNSLEVHYKFGSAFKKINQFFVKR